MISRPCLVISVACLYGRKIGSITYKIKNIVAKQTMVEVKDQRITKPYLGGWRHAVTGVIYCNAASQTGPLEKSNVGNLCTREVQCIDTRNNTCQSTVDVATQMWRKDCYVSSESDKYLTAKPYVSFEQFQRQEELNQKASSIQKCYRSWRMLKNIKECTIHYRKLMEDCQKVDVHQSNLHRQRNQLAIIRQTFPQSRSDFEKIYALIESWKQSRVAAAEKTLFQGSRLAENWRILEQTMEMLRNVEKHSSYIVAEQRSKNLTSFLDHHCNPVTWKGQRSGQSVQMDTLRVQKAREFKSLYDNLNISECTMQERLELLGRLKNSLDTHSCWPAIDLSNLIDQELVLSSRIKGLSLKNLGGRISMAFLHFVRQSHDCCFGDENSGDMKLSNPVEEKLFCLSCKQLKSRKKFEVHATAKKPTCCQSCAWLRRRTIEQIDYDPYTYLLSGIRAEEHRRNCLSTLLYVIQEPDIYHLVRNIWHGRSIVSEVDDIFRLRLIRFNVKQDWTPWNCILLTEQESEVHYYIRDLNDVYSKHLLKKINLLHRTARSHFKELTRLERKLCSIPEDLQSLNNDKRSRV